MQAILQENTALRAKSHQLQTRPEAVVSTTLNGSSLEAQVTEKFEKVELEREKPEEEKKKLTNEITEKYRAADPSDEEKPEALNEINSRIDSINSQWQSVTSTAAALSMMEDREASNDVEAPVDDVSEFQALRKRVVELEEENDRLTEELGRKE